MIALARTIRTVFILLGLLLAPVVKAYESERAANNLAHEFAACSAYFALVSQAPGLRQQNAEWYLKASIQAFYMSSGLTSDKLTTARAELETKKMKRDMDNTWDNTSIINNKYGYPCKDLMEKPEERREYWLLKED